MPPVKSKNGLKQGVFCNEFNDYFEKLSCMSGNIVIVGDFNIDWLNTNGSERKRFHNILEIFGFVQNICTETHRSHHLLDYIITRKDCNIISDCTVSDFISDHLVLHASLQSIRPYPFLKQIAVRALRRIKDDALAEELDRFNVDQGCVDVDIMIEQYDKYLSGLLNKHVPKKNIYVVDRPLNEWMTDDILTLKAIRRKNELIWRKTRTTINFDIYYDSCEAVKEAISKRKSELMEQRVIDCEGDQKKLYSLIHSLLGSKKNTVLPEYTSSFTLASTINMFFIDKISTIKMEFPLLEACLPMYSFVDIDIIMPACTAVEMQLTADVAVGFNQRKPPDRTVCVAVDLSAAFDTVCHNNLLSKINRSQLPPATVQWLSCYLRGRQAKTCFRGVKSTSRKVNTGVPQGSKLSPSLFSFYIADMPIPTEPVKRVCYADDLTVWASGVNIPDLEVINNYLEEITAYLKDNSLLISAPKSSVTLLTPDTHQAKIHPRIFIENSHLPLVKCPRILGVYLDPSLSFNKYNQYVAERVSGRNNIL